MLIMHNPAMHAVIILLIFFVYRKYYSCILSCNKLLNRITISFEDDLIISKINNSMSRERALLSL